MAGRKTIFTSFVIVLAVCFLMPFMALAEEGEQLDDEYTPGFYYTVKKGDTLWDLSKKFYDSEWQWPAMWGQNKTLTNPHLIYPGQRIRLYQRVDAIKQVDENIPITAEQATSEEQATQATTLTETVHYIYPGIAYVGFVKKLSERGRSDKLLDDPLAMGVILKAAGEKKEMISQDDTVYINPLPSQATEVPFIIGNRYSIYIPPTPVNDPLTGDYAGHQYKIVGTAEVTAIDSEYVTAKIIKSLDTINAGYLIMPFDKRDKEIPISPSPADLTGALLLAEEHTEMSAENSIVFMNKGKQDGVQAGQQYDIYYQDKSEIDGKEVLLPRYVFGKLLVLRTEETTATGVITKSIKPRPVSRGDLFQSAR